MIKVTYIFHSCYVIEFERFSVVFDFYKDIPTGTDSYWMRDYLLNKQQDLYVLSTHSHADHFNPDIFGWKQRKENIKYIFSQEIFDEKSIDQQEIIYLDKLETYKDDNLKIAAFGSTDTGASFLLDVNDKKIFHAGDLNNWHWNEEVSVQEASTFENNFLCELELIAEESNEVFLAMFPVDPRLGKDYMRGAEQFVKRISTDYFLPLHFGENYQQANRFTKLAKMQNSTFLQVTHQGQSFEI